MYTVIFVTASSNKEAHCIAEELIKNRLAACVNIIDNIESIFWWQGKVNKAKEALLIIKTRKSKINSLIKKVSSLHSYKVPEIVALPIFAGNKKYLEWVNESTS